MPPSAGPSLRIVAINDVYSLENLPRLRTLIERHRADDPADAFLVTLAGDFVGPSTLSSLDAGRGMVSCLNALGVTHVTFGNHEDDIPSDALRAREAELHATWLDTNVHGVSPALPAHALVDVRHPGGRTVRVGLLGVVMHDPAVYRRVPFGATRVDPANAAAMAEAARLVADDGCACVVPLTHQPLDDDRALARSQRTPRFPVIVGGHEHVPFLELVDGTWVVKAGADAVGAIVLELVWPAAPPAGTADLPSVTVRYEPVAGYAEDAALRTRVDAHMTRVNDLERATLMTLAPGQTLSSLGMRARETTMGSLVCSRVRDTLGADGCVFNAGGIRGSRDYHGRITYGDLKAEVPFDNEVVVVPIPGAVLRDAIAVSRAHAPAESGGFLQVDDRMSVDERSHTLTAIAGAPLDPAREYRIALVRDLLLGMDHIEPLRRFGEGHPDKVPPPGSGRDVKLVLVDAFSVALWETLGGFDAVDTNADGVVDESEIAAAVTRVTAEAASPVTTDLILGAFDTDHDRTISRTEAATREKK